jgi:hypothetical protein
MIFGTLFPAQSMNLTNARLFVNPVPEDRGARVEREQPLNGQPVTLTYSCSIVNP